jgi:hypothetical protein
VPDDIVQSFLSNSIKAERDFLRNRPGNLVASESNLDAALLCKVVTETMKGRRESNMFE